MSLLKSLVLHLLDRFRCFYCRKPTVHTIRFAGMSLACCPTCYTTHHEKEPA